jgi:uncharacterized protein (TIGR03437 family)
VTANPSGLSEGTYNGSVSITPTGGVATIVPVVLTLTSAPTLTAAPASLSFTASQTAGVPSSASVQISGKPSGIAFLTSVSTRDGANWLSVAPNAGLTPATVSVSVDPSLLSAGSYSGSILIYGSTGTVGAQVNVTLTVQAPPPTITGVANSAGFQSGPIAPGELIAIFGTALGPAAGAGSVLDASGKVATTNSGVQVVFLPSGVLAPLLYVGGSQVNAVVPYEIGGSSVSIQIKYAGQTSSAFPLTTTGTAPALFTQNGLGTGPAAALNADLSLNSSSNPASRGSMVVIYLTGEGPTSPPGITGSITTVASSPPLTPQPLAPVTVRVNGESAPILFFGEAPALVSGVLQINFQVPGDAPLGDVPIQVSVGPNISHSGVTISVK